MKTVGMLLILVVLVAGVAVNGSRAQTLPLTSVAFEQCSGASGVQTDRCRSVIAALAAGGEVAGDFGMDVGDNYGGDYGTVDQGFGGDLSSPEFLAAAVRAAVRAALVELARRAIDQIIGGTMHPVLDAHIDPGIFDPVR